MHLKLKYTFENFQLEVLAAKIFQIVKMQALRITEWSSYWGWKYEISIKRSQFFLKKYTI